MAHFAERYGLFVIICLGESIVAIGVGANGRPIDAQLVLAAACGLLITVGLWWTYFDRLAAAAEEHLRDHDGSRHLSDGARLALCGGIALYLIGQAAFRLRVIGTLSHDTVLAAVAGDWHLRGRGRPAGLDRSPPASPW